MNDAVGRSGREDARGSNDSKHRRTRPEPEEELETGEPIDDEVPAPKKKPIRARVVPFDGRAPRRRGSDATCDRDRTERTDSDNPQNGQMVLTTAKYMPAPPPEPEAHKRGRRGQPAEQASSLEGRVFHGGKWGGMLAMAVAVVWFMAGLMNDVIFFYPPILFVIGLGAFIKDTVKSD